MPMPSPTPVRQCPICQQPACSLAHVYARLTAPAVNAAGMGWAR